MISKGRLQTALMKSVLDGMEVSGFRPSGYEVKQVVDSAMGTFDEALSGKYDEPAPPPTPPAAPTQPQTPAPTAPSTK